MSVSRLNVPAVAVQENGWGRGRKNSLETNISRAKTDAFPVAATNISLLDQQRRG
jgi:hypothetical protein